MLKMAQNIKHMCAKQVTISNFLVMHIHMDCDHNLQSYMKAGKNLFVYVW